MRGSSSCALTLVLACLSAGARAAAADAPSQAALEESAVFSWEHRVSGRIVSVKGTMIEIEARDRRRVEVDVAPAIKSHRAYVLAVGGAITAYGSYDQKGVLHAKGVSRAKRLPIAWPADR